MSVLPGPAAASEAVVLRTWPTGETSLVASLLTADHGFVKVIAKGARRTRSALRPLVQPGRLVHAEFSLSPRRDLQYLRGGSLIRDPLAAADLETHAYLLSALELVDRCRDTAAASDDGRRSGAELFGLCQSFLTVLSSAPRGSEPARFYAFELRLLDRLGLAPETDSCTSCGRTAAGPAEPPWFSPAQGGVICARCGGAADARAMTDGAAMLLRALGEMPPSDWPGTILSAAERREVGILLHRFMGYHLPGYRLPAALELLRRPGRTEDHDGGDGEQ
ncbi:MAG: DNA repair protein RecO [Candidatus Krumholzibacteriia bacterium]